MTRQAFDANPNSGNSNAGLEVLKAVKRFHPKVRALAFTDRDGVDSLRRDAQKLGLSVPYFVSKISGPDNPWEAQLIYRVLHIEREIAADAVLPLTGTRHLPAIRFRKKVNPPNRKPKSRNTTRYEITFCGSPWSLTAQRENLIEALARHPHHSISYKDLEGIVYRDNVKAIPVEGIKHLVKHMRITIQLFLDEHRRILGILPYTDLQDLARDILADTRNEGYLLNARVIFEDHEGQEEHADSPPATT